jgi:hypothetical protein
MLGRLPLLTCTLILTLFAWSLAAFAEDKTPSGPIVCQDDNSLTARNKIIKVKGDGITVKDNCSLTLIDSVIQVEGRGVVVQDNGSLKIMGCVISGRKGALAISENGSVSASASTIAGRITTTENGEFKNGGKNVIKKAPEVGAVSEPAKDEKKEADAPKSSLEKSGAVQCVGTEDLTVANKLIETDGDGISTTGTCSVTVTNCQIKAKGAALALQGTGTITIKDSVVEGAKAAIKIVGTGNVEARGCTIRGKIQRTGTGRFLDKGNNKRK